MRKMSKKIIVSVLTLVLTVVALGTTTYAWFTVGGTVAVEEFEMQVTSGIGLEIAYLHQGYGEESEDLNWVKTLNKNDLYTYLYVDYYEGGNIGTIDNSLNYPNLFMGRFTMDAFTSEDGRILKSMNEEDYSLTQANKTAGFIEFTLAFRTKEALGNGLPLYLNDVTFNSVGVDWKPEKQFTVIGDGTGVFGPGDPKRTFYAANGARISLTDNKNLSTLSTIFEKATSGDDNRQLSNNPPIYDQGAHSYYSAITNVDLKDYFGEDGTVFANYKAAPTITGISGTQMEIAQFAAGTDYNYAQVTIRIYLEGFDSETFNAIFEDMIEARFGFNLQLD